MCPKMLPRASQEPPKTPPRGPKSAPRGPKMRPAAPKITQMTPRSPPKGSKRPPRGSKKHPRGSQEPPRDPKGPCQDSESLPNVSQENPLGSKVCENLVKRVCPGGPGRWFAAPRPLVKHSPSTRQAPPKHPPSLTPPLELILELPEPT